MIRHPLLAIIAGFVLWSGLFLVFYGVQATGCYLSGDETSAIVGRSFALRVFLLALGATGTAFVIYSLLKSSKNRAASDPPGDTAHFTQEVAYYVWMAAAVATPFCFSGVVFLTLCGT